MKAAAWMAAASVASGLLAMAIAGRRHAIEILAGMTAPLVAAGVSWIVTERIWRRDPMRLTGAMMSAFVAKIVFFGGYVALMLKVADLAPAPFVASFTSYFIALYVTEALLLRRLFAAGGADRT